MYDGTAFSDELALFEVALNGEGFPFDGFEITVVESAPSLAQLVGNAHEELLRLAPKVRLGDKVADRLQTAKRHMMESNFVECLTNLRLALKYTLEGIAETVAAQRGETLSSVKEKDVRDYLKRIGFISEEEWRGFWGIYGLLSTGPHGDPTRDATLLGFAACMMACQYAIEKLQRVSP